METKIGQTDGLTEGRSRVTLNAPVAYGWGHKKLLVLINIAFSVHYFQVVNYNIYKVLGI